VQLGIKLQGETKLATTHDAYTTNPRGTVKAQKMAARAGQAPPPKFEKVPRPEKQTLTDIARVTDTSHPLYDAELSAAYKQERAEAERLARENPGKHWTEFFDLKKWHQLALVTPERTVGGVESFLMLDKQSWREPFSGNQVYNEVILDDWKPEAIILNPRSATLDQIKQFKKIADEHGLKLLDTDEQEILVSHFARADRSDFPKRYAASDATSSSSTEMRPDGTYGPIKRSSDDEVLGLDDRMRQYESVRRRWSRLAGMLEG
jgi:hypothetical protein